MPGQRHGPGGATREHGPAGVGVEERPPDLRPGERVERVRGLAPGQVDQVRLPDGLAGGGVRGIAPMTDEHRLHLRAEAREMRHAHRRPALEDVIAVGVRGRRQDHDARPVTTGCLEQGPVEVEHRGKELAGADQRHGAAHRAEV